MKIVLFTIGTRGDVQPYLALAAGLQRAGHAAILAAPRAYADWIESYGVTAHPVDFDIRAIMEHPETLAALRSGDLLRQFRLARAAMRAGMRLALLEFERAAQSADYLIQTIGGHGAVEIAGSRGVPMAFAYLQPFARTGAFPSFFLGQAPTNLGGGFNRLTHWAAEYGVWLTYGQPTDEWRAARFSLPPWRTLGNVHAAGEHLGALWLFAFSPALLPRPADWDERHHVTGYWFLDTPADWRPAPALADFLAAGPPPVYVGFGSLQAADAGRLTGVVVEALRRAGQRGLLAAGWGGLQPADAPHVFSFEGAPHDWLFPRVAAVVHHGGAGTTGAALRAGVPQIITPFVLDQYGWARQVIARGLGPRAPEMRRLTVENLAQAIRVAVTDAGLRRQAAALGVQVRAEGGVTRAVALIECHAAAFQAHRF